MSAVSEAIYHLRKPGGTETIFCPVDRARTGNYLYSLTNLLYGKRGIAAGFNSSCNLKQIQIAACAMFKMDVAVVGTVIQEGYQVLEPILQIWQGNTMQDLLCHLTEAEKQKIYLLDQSYRQTEQKIFFAGLQSLCWITSESKECRQGRCKLKKVIKQPIRIK